jgi:hypothetical protein
LNKHEDFPQNVDLFDTIQFESRRFDGRQFCRRRFDVTPKEPPPFEAPL